MNLRRTLINRPMQERFDAYYCAIPIAGCWIWEGTLKNGYGVLKQDRRPIYAHRLSWELAFGQIPDGMEICHRCDVKQCVNPAHLFLGTHRDNMLDAWSKGRTKQPPARSGIAHCMAKLSVDQVLAIRKRFVEGDKHKVIAMDFGITSVNVRHIGHGKTWRHI